MIIYNIFSYIKYILCCKEAEYKRVNQQINDEIWLDVSTTGVSVTSIDYDEQTEIESSYTI